MALILVLLVMMAPLTPHAAPSVFTAPMIPVASLLNSDGTLNLSTGASGAVDLRGWEVTLDSVRGPVLTPQASAPAIASAGDLSALANNGLNGPVYALAESGGDLYVGGNFTQTAVGSVTLNRIARYGFPLYALYLPVILK